MINRLYVNHGGSATILVTFMQHILYNIYSRDLYKYFVRAYADKRTIWTIPIVLMLATGIPTALAAHTPAYLYGFGLGKNAGLRGYYDVMNDCSNRRTTNVTGAIKNFTSL
jgi:hypothetical protein